MAFPLRAEQGKVVSAAVMERIYEQVKTPHKYGVILAGDEGAKLDCPSVFRHGGAWYMVYIIFDGSGYETALARSDDLLHWKPLGKILRFRPGAWDAKQAAGFIALQDHAWGGSYRLKKHDGTYWLSYLGGALEGYETDPPGGPRAHAGPARRAGVRGGDSLQEQRHSRCERDARLPLCHVL
jgi:beta-xylosidase